jgi:hypothetical protein
VFLLARPAPPSGEVFDDTDRLIAAL